MGDVFIERMIKKKFETMDMLILLGIVVAMIVVVFIGFIVGFFIFPFPMLTFLVALGAGFGGYKLLTMRLLEYEYSLTNGFVAVDKIMNRSTRKRIKPCFLQYSTAWFRSSPSRQVQRIILSPAALRSLNISISSIFGCPRSGYFSAKFNVLSKSTA